jgi:acetoin utilization protein AcuB
MQPTIEQFMTRQVHTIRGGAKLSEAHELMRDHHIRHLPVLEGGRLVGLVSDRDLHLIETLGAGTSNEITVEEAMSQDVLVVAPNEPLGEVAQKMGSRKAGSAVVVLGERVLGIFTTMDALRVLAEHVWAPPEAARVRMAPHHSPRHQRPTPRRES